MPARRRVTRPALRPRAGLDRHGGNVRGRPSSGRGGNGRHPGARDRLPRADIAGAIDGLLASREIVVEQADRVGLANDRYRQGGAGFSDQMIALAAREAGCAAVLSFDLQAISGAGMTAVPAPA